MSVSHIIFNTIVAFIVIYILSRMLGKKLISQMTFFDFVAGVSLGSLVGSVILAVDVPIWKGSISLIVFAAISFVVDYISFKSYRGRKVLNDVPTPIIKEGKILVEGMKKVRLTIDDLLFQLRKKDIFYLDEVDYAFLETDGTISTLKKSGKQSPTISDMYITTLPRGLPQTFIIDGNLLPNVLEKIGKDEKWVQGILEHYKINGVKDILVAQMDNQMKVYVSLKNQ